MTHFITGGTFFLRPEIVFDCVEDFFRVPRKLLSINVPKRSATKYPKIKMAHINIVNKISPMRIHPFLQRVFLLQMYNLLMSVSPDFVFFLQRVFAADEDDRFAGVFLASDFFSFLR